jgi:hypothetical protein
MQIQDLIRLYEMKTDEELIELATEPAQLTIEANTALAGELARRRIDAKAWLDRCSENDQISVERPEPVKTSSLQPQGHSEFITEVLRVYHRQFWFFIKLIAPAVVVGYVAVYLSRQEAREILRDRGVELLKHPIEMFEMELLNFAGYFSSWMAFSFSFGAICAGVYQIETTKDVPSVKGSFAEVCKSIGAFLRLSLLLFFLCFVVHIVSASLSTGIVQLLLERHIHPNGFAIFIFSFVFMGLALLVLSRFALAVPAVVLGHYRPGRAMFRSDELTEGKWLILAALLSKSLIGGYVAGMAPFWLARWIANSIYLPWWYPWVCAVVSTLAVIVIEPTMFIGFALLYLRMSAISPASNEIPTARLV